MGTNLSKWASDVAHIHIHQKVTSAEGGFNNEVERMTHLVSFFPQPSLLLSNGPMNKVAMMAEKKVIHRLDNMDFQSPRLIWL